MKYWEIFAIMFPASAILAFTFLMAWHEDKDRMDRKIFDMQLQLVEAKAELKACEVRP